MKTQTTIRTLKKKKPASQRRGKGQGTIWQDRSGKWRGQISVGIKLDGTADRRSFSGATQEEVQRKLNDFIQLMNAPAQAQDTKYPAPASPTSAPIQTHITVAQITHRWLWDYKRIEICSKTCEWYEHLIKNMIEPHIGGLSLGRVNALTVQTLINRLATVDAYATRTVRGIRSILYQSFALAVQLGLMQNNPAANIKLPKQRSRAKRDSEKVIPIDVRSKVLNAAAADPMMRAVITTLMFTGLRIGELLALRWSDVNFKTGFITVEKAVVRRPVYNEQGDRVALKNEVSEPKTDSSFRTVRMTQPVIDALQAWKTHLREQKYGVWLIRPDCFLFTNRKTRRPYTYTGFRTVYYRFLERNGLKQYGLNLHSYRHTFATMLLETGVNPKVAQSLLGHASISTTLGVYTHVTTELYDGVADSLSNAYELTLAGKYRPTGR